MNAPDRSVPAVSSTERRCLTCMQPVSLHKGFKCPDVPDEEPEPQYACGECGKPIKCGCYCTKCAKELNT